MPRGRYAPSPTGPLHLGNLRSAALCWLHARLGGATFVLRVEVNDGTRSRPAWTVQMLEDLRWLGLDWDEGPAVGGPYPPYSQSACGGRYQAALTRLIDAGVAYPCACSRAALRQDTPGANWLYPGTCRGRAPDEVLAECARAGREPAWRVRVPPGERRVDDGLCGVVVQDLAQAVGDYVVRRADGVWAYQLAVVVDDGAQHIDEVVRGADLLDSAPRQAWLHGLLGTRPPRTWHLPLLRDEGGRKLSKRDAAASVRSLPGWPDDPAAVLAPLLADIAPGARSLPGALDALGDRATLEARLRALPP